MAKTILGYKILFIIFPKIVTFIIFIIVQLVY